MPVRKISVLEKCRQNIKKLNRSPLKKYSFAEIDEKSLSTTICPKNDFAFSFSIKKTNTEPS